MNMNGFWVYTHITPDGFVYVGRSGEDRTNYRWQSSHYNHTSLEKHIEKWGWQNITHEIVKDDLSKDESYQLEDKLIRHYSALGICLNKRGSGGLLCDGEHREEYYQTHRDELLEYQRQYRESHRDYQRQYRESHREELKDKGRQYYQAHREEIMAYQRQYRESHREEQRARDKAWRAAHRDQINAKKRARYAAKRAAKKQQKSPKLTTPATNQNTQPSDYQWGDPLF